MSRLRFSIAQLMAVVLLIGFGFAALRNANDVWAGVTFGLAIVTVSMGLAGACSRQAGARMPWAGFGIAGGLRLVVWLSTSSIVGHLTGVPYPLLHRLQPYINTEAHHQDRLSSLIRKSTTPWMWFFSACSQRS
jgi:hypothetical protein